MHSRTYTCIFEVKDHLQHNSISFFFNLKYMFIIKYVLGFEFNNLFFASNLTKKKNKNLFVFTANNVVQVAFFVRLRDKITNHHLSTIMVFDDVQLNMGNAYDPHVGTFTAPVEGVYKFDLVLSSNVENGHGEMMHNGVRILDVYADKVNQSFYAEVL